MKYRTVHQVRIDILRALRKFGPLIPTNLFTKANLEWNRWQKYKKVLLDNGFISEGLELRYRKKPHTVYLITTKGLQYLEANS